MSLERGYMTQPNFGWYEDLYMQFLACQFQSLKAQAAAGAYCTGAVMATLNVPKARKPLIFPALLSLFPKLRPKSVVNIPVFPDGFLELNRDQLVEWLQRIVNQLEEIDAAEINKK